MEAAPAATDSHAESQQQLPVAAADGSLLTWVQRADLDETPR